MNTANMAEVAKNKFPGYHLDHYFGGNYGVENWIAVRISRKTV